MTQPAFFIKTLFKVQRKLKLIILYVFWCILYSSG